MPVIDLHFGDITVLQLRALINQRRVVAHDVVNRDASGESNASLQLFALLASESLLHFFLNHVVDGVADGGDIGARDSEFASLFEAG